MEWSLWITLSILVGVVVVLVVIGIIAHRESVHTRTRKAQNELTSLLFDIFTTNSCAVNPEGNSGNHTKYVEPYLDDKINLDFITRKCSYDD